MSMHRLLAVATVLTLATTPAWAVGTTLSLTLGDDQPADFDQKVVHYSCATGDPFSATYVNAAPNFLALVPVEGATLVFAGVASTDGSKYVSGHWVWWSKGSDARLYDLGQGDKAEPVNTCSEVIDTP